jgi:ATP-binding cassette subfamily B protein
VSPPQPQVGASGSGKSTVVSLVQRLYGVQAGRVLIDGTPVDSISPKTLHNCIALVEQQPKLFYMTIAENIAYSVAGDDTPVLPEEIEEAARLAHAHDFISKMEDGYNTNVGVLGGKLSGGQAQRVAIARALFRAKRIKMLLLDEYVD